MSEELDLEAQYQEYLTSMGLEEDVITARLAIKIRRAFFGGVHHLLDVIGSELDDQDMDEKFRNKLYSIANQSALFWIAQNNYILIDPVPIKYTAGFLAYLKEENIVNQEIFSLEELYHIYINSICWKEIPGDPDLPQEHLKVRV